MPTPAALARTSRTGWRRALVDERGQAVERLVLCRPVLWYAVCPDRQVLLVIVRDPNGKQRDDFFFSTDLEASGAGVAAHYAGRWSIEDTFRNVKQALGGEDPQTWKGAGPERAAALSLWLYSAVWSWDHHDAGGQAVLAVPALVPREAHAILCRCPGGPAPGVVEAPDFPGVRPTAAPPENRRAPRRSSCSGRLGVLRSGCRG